MKGDRAAFFIDANTHFITFGKARAMGGFLVFAEN
jgi:hypothetical protein